MLSVSPGGASTGGMAPSASVRASSSPPSQRTATPIFAMGDPSKARKFTSSAGFVAFCSSASSLIVVLFCSGCWRDNVFVERLWKSVKYEEIYLHGYESVSEVRQALARYFDFYNRRRPHSTLDGKTPDTAYFNPSLLAAAA